MTACLTFRMTSCPVRTNLAAISIRRRRNVVASLLRGRMSCRLFSVKVWLLKSTQSTSSYLESLTMLPGREASLIVM